VDAFAWFFEHDSRWHWQAEVLRSFGVLEVDNTGEHGPDELGAVFRVAGYTSVEVADDAYELVFRDADDWWRWAWSHGSRQLFEAVPATRHAELKDSLFGGLARCRQARY
jgi:hypothetical protein